MRPELLELQASLEDEHWWFSGRRRILVTVVEMLLGGAHDSLVLDIGCGTGGNARAVAARYRCVGIDPSEMAISLARRTRSDAEFRVGRAPEDFPELMEEADVVLLTDVLEHVEDDGRFFRRLYAAGRPGSYYVLTVPANPGVWSSHDVELGHQRRYTRASLRSLWSDTGARVLLLSHFNARLYSVAWLARKFPRVFGVASGRAGTDLWLPPAWLNRPLRGVFAGERRRLTAPLRGEAGTSYPRGLSLIAVIMKPA